MSDPAEKYRDKVDPQHKMAMDAIGLFHWMLGQHREHFEKLIHSEQNMHSWGGIVDPTFYRDMLYSKSFAQQMRLVQAALAFLKEIDAVKGELDAQQSPRS